MKGETKYLYLFFERLSWTEEIRANWSRKKDILVLHQRIHLYLFLAFETFKFRMKYLSFYFYKPT